MTLISKLKAFLGLDSSRRHEGGTTVTVEREASAETEREVKESPPPSDSDAAAVGSSPSVADEEPAASEPTAAAAGAEASDEPVQSIKGIGPSYAERLAGAGVETVGDLSAADAAELADATDIAEGRVTDWIARARGS